MYAHLDDVCSDMSVFHRINDIRTLSGATFARLAWRLPAYQGRMAVVVQELQQQDQPASSPPSVRPSSEASPPVRGTAEVLRGHHAAVAAPQLMQDAPVFSYATAT